MNPSLIAALKEMRNIDQDVRNQAGGNQQSVENYLVYIIDQVHNARLKRLIAKHGMPSPDTIGDDGLEDFWLLIQHQDTDLDLQKECLEKCGFAPKQCAYLTDRVLVNSGEPQLYGTQFHRDPTGRLVPRPIKDADEVDNRRAEAGLDSLGDYAERMKKHE